MTDVKIDGATFRVEVEGDEARPCVVLSNSLGTDLGLWDGQMAGLLKHFRVIRYDSRGHGGSAVGRPPYSLARLGRDVLAILDAFEIERTHFVGISMGGAVGQWLLANAPKRLERVVLVATAAKIGTPDGWNARIASVLHGGMAANADATLKRWLSVEDAAKHPDRAAALRAMLETTSPEGYAGASAALRDMDLRQALGLVKTPVLVVSGTRDPSISSDAIRTLVEAIPAARHVALDAMHIVNVGAAEDFDAAVLQFLTAKLPARTRGAAPMPFNKREGAVRRKREAATARKPLARTLPLTLAASADGRGKGGKTTRKSATAKLPARREASAAAAKGARALAERTRTAPPSKPEGKVTPEKATGKTNAARAAASQLAAKVAGRSAATPAVAKASAKTKATPRVSAKSPAGSSSASQSNGGSRTKGTAVAKPASGTARKLPARRATAASLRAKSMAAVPRSSAKDGNKTAARPNPNSATKTGGKAAAPEAQGKSAARGKSDQSAPLPLSKSAKQKPRSPSGLPATKGGNARPPGSAKASSTRSTRNDMSPTRPTGSRKR